MISILTFRMAALEYSGKAGAGVDEVKAVDAPPSLIRSHSLARRTWAGMALLTRSDSQISASCSASWDFFQQTPRQTGGRGKEPERTFWLKTSVTLDRGCVRLAVPRGRTKRGGRFFYRRPRIAAAFSRSITPDSFSLPPLPSSRKVRGNSPAQVGSRA